MSSSFLYRKLAQAYPAGAAEVALGAADEERIYDMPNLLSWFSADSSYFNAGTGVYKDKGPRGNNWQQATVAQQPTAVPNWRSTGWPALSFDGVNDRIPALFNAPVGPMTLVAVCDVLINDVDQAVIGSNVGNTVFAQYYLEMYHAAPFAFCRFGTQGRASVGVVGTCEQSAANRSPTTDPVSGTLDCQLQWGSVNSGTWFTTVAPAVRARQPGRDDAVGRVPHANREHLHRQHRRGARVHRRDEGHLRSHDAGGGAEGEIWDPLTASRSRGTSTA
jgi:hypothetical protein